jgi:predicted XRE-type DNA-binding protein
MMKNKHVGSSFDDFLDEEGLLAETEAVALKRVLAFQIQKNMEAKKVTKSKMANLMKTSRSSLDRLLDPENSSVTLLTLEKAALTLGKRLKVELV